MSEKIDLEALERRYSKYAEDDSDRIAMLALIARLREQESAQNGGEAVAGMRKYHVAHERDDSDPGYTATTFHQNKEYAAAHPDENTPLFAAPPAANAGMGEWIAASERGPLPGETVLVAVEFDGPGDWRIKCGGITNANDRLWTVFGASWTPTHWQPLPAAPKPSKTEG